MGCCSSKEEVIDLVTSPRMRVVVPESEPPVLPVAAIESPTPQPESSADARVTETDRNLVDQEQVLKEVLPEIKKMKKITSVDTSNRDGDILSMKLSSNGTLLATVHSGTYFCLWDVASGEMCADIPMFSEIERGTKLEFSGNGKWVASSSFSGEGGEIQIYSISDSNDTKRESVIRDPRPVFPSLVTFSANSTRLFVGANVDAVGELWSFDADTIVRQEHALENAKDRTPTLISADDQYLLTTSVGGVAVYELDTGKLKYEIDAYAASIALSADSQRLVIADSVKGATPASYRLSVYELATGALLVTIDTGSTTGVPAFNSTGTSVVLRLPTGRQFNVYDVATSSCTFVGQIDRALEYWEVSADGSTICGTNPESSQIDIYSFDKAFAL